MATPFWQYRQKSVYDKASKDPIVHDIDDCSRDWERDQADIFIGGERLWSGLGERPVISSVDLEGIWRSKLLSGLLDSQQVNFIHFFSENFHQTGIPAALQRGLKAIALEKGHSIGGEDIRATVSFNRVGNKLIIKEDVALVNMTLGRNDKYKTRKLAADYDSDLLTATAIYSIDLTATSPTVECVDLVLNQHNTTTAKIFDTRSILDKIIDFFKSLVGANKLHDPVDRQEQKPK